MENSSFLTTIGDLDQIVVIVAMENPVFIGKFIFVQVYTLYDCCRYSRNHEQYAQICNYSVFMSHEIYKYPLHLLLVQNL